VNVLPNKARFEIKYFVPRVLGGQMREAIAPYVELDPYSKKEKERAYTVRSIYYDTAEFDYHFEKLDGLKVRKKLRIRTYNTYKEQKTAFFEIKRRYNQVIIKERAELPISKAREFITQPSLEFPADIDDRPKRVVLSKFFYNYLREALEPKLLVVYEREAYVGLQDRSVRVTFDTNLRFHFEPEIDEIFTDNGFIYRFEPYYILELKFNGFMPKWMRQLTRQFSLSAQSISKYCSGVEVFIERESSSTTLLNPHINGHHGIRSV
jgi:SPX domain protein involved in polyphosphate accumulation